MNKAELVRALSLLPDEYEVHIEGQEIVSVEVHEHSDKRLIMHENVGWHFEDKKTKGVINLIAEQVNEG